MSASVVGVTIEQGRAFHTPLMGPPPQVSLPCVLEHTSSDTLQPLQPLMLHNSGSNLSNHAPLQAIRGVQTRPFLSGCSLSILAGPHPLREEPPRTAQVSELQTFVHPDVVLVARAKTTWTCVNKRSPYKAHWLLMEAAGWKEPLPSVLALDIVHPQPYVRWWMLIKFTVIIILPYI